MKVLVTGAAGFIGMHVARALLARGDQVLGIDSLNDYYDPALKCARLGELSSHTDFEFRRLDITDAGELLSLFSEQRFERVVHLAAQAGVRHSITHPHDYVQANLVGFLNVLEACRHHQIIHLVYASSSSVYGGNRKMPFSEADRVDHPVSLYAATKKANELIAHSYSHLYGLPCTGLRFFTVYGPWGRPDMACFSFTRAILAGEPIAVFNHGKMSRDFTYIDDIVRGVVGAFDHPPEIGADGTAANRVLNIGSHAPVPLLNFIKALEQALGLKARIDLQPMQAGDVPDTYADVSSLAQITGTAGQSTPLEEGIARFVAWYQHYYSRPCSSQPTILRSTTSQSTTPGLVHAE
jgi:UDP-glucuronate 4-epimerase